MYDNINDDNEKRNCFKRLCNPKSVGYISNIGVIDEIRKIGIGKILLSKSIEILKLKKTCIGVYLHVIKHNKSAINFYVSNEFSRGKYIENHYYIQKNYYDAIIFYKLFKINKKVIPDNNYNQNKIKYEIIQNNE